MILNQKKYLHKRVVPLHSRVVAFLVLWRENTINAQCIISTNQPPFSMQITIMRKITDSWCYEERNYRNISTSYTRVLEVKEGTDLYRTGNVQSHHQQGKDKWYEQIVDIDTDLSVSSTKTSGWRGLQISLSGIKQVTKYGSYLREIMMM